jgi:hypothetical protein
MKPVQLATKIDERVKKSMEKICKRRGLKLNRFIEDAILDKLEELEDLEELKALRREKFRPIEDVLQDLKKSGKI